VDPLRSAPGGYAVRRRRLAAVAAIAGVAISLLVPSAGSAAPDAQATTGAPAAQLLAAAGSPGELAALEARVARLTRQYRGQLNTLIDAEDAARAATAAAARLGRRLLPVQREVARLAAASYMGVMQSPMGVVLGGGDTQRILQEVATLQYLTRQQGTRQQALLGMLAAAQQVRQAARARIANLARLLAKLAGQRRRVDALLAKFLPQSPVIGDNITPRMRAVKDAIDHRFGPFVDIGCYRPGNDGEHPLGRACDFMLSTGGGMPTPANVQRGYAIAAWAQANAARLGIMYIIYRQRIWDIRIASAGWQLMADRGSITANHFDHVHISVF
jgi:hypothetical protein